jgi:putative ABC transport system permease protein
MWWTSQIHQVVLQLKSGSDVEKTGKVIKAYFEQRYGVSGQFNVDNESKVIAQMKRFLKLFAILLAGISLLSLAVGGIGINNMMLVSVTERIKEFGLRKALGATHRSIRLQVLLESLTLCTVAGLIGAFIGFGVYESIIFGASHFVPNLKFEWIAEPLAIFLSMISIITVGILSGLVPALRAERLQVIEALRSE